MRDSSSDSFTIFGLALGKIRGMASSFELKGDRGIAEL